MKKTAAHIPSPPPSARHAPINTTGMQTT